MGTGSGPSQARSTAAAGPRQQDAQNEDPAMKLSGLHILLAEDNPTNQLVATQMLETLGASVSVAADGAEALEMIGAEPFDVVLVDIEMPRVSGIDVIRRVRETQGPIADTPMIALTAYVMREHREPIMSAGADGIIPKPIVSIEQFGDEVLAMSATRRDRRVRAGARPEPLAGACHRGAEGDELISREIYDSLADAIGPDSMSELLERVNEDLSDAGVRLGKALERRDVKEIRAGTHILISVAGAIGAVGLQHACQTMNAAANRNDLDHVMREGPEMIALLARVRNHVGKQLMG